MLNDIEFNGGEISAYKDWNIVLTKAEIPMPTPKTSTVDIKGADGLLDLSEVLTNDIKYNNRSIKLTFELLDVTEYHDKISTIGNYLNGKVVTFSFSNDENYYYTGRASITTWECSANKGKIVITINADPYKYETNENIFMFELKGTTKSVILKNSRKHVCPTLNVTGRPTLTFKGKTIQLTAGEQQLVDFVLDEGDNAVSMGGVGTIQMIYREGSL